MGDPVRPPVQVAIRGTDIYVTLPENWRDMLSAGPSPIPVDEFKDLRIAGHIYGDKMVVVVGSALCPPEMEGVPGIDEMYYFLTQILKLDLPTPDPHGVRKYSVSSKVINSGENAGMHYWRIELRYVPATEE